METDTKNLEIQRAIRERNRLKRKQSRFGHIVSRSQEIQKLNDSISLLIELSKDQVNDISEQTLHSLAYSQGQMKELEVNLQRERKRVNFVGIFVKGFYILLGSIFIAKVFF